MKTESPRHKRAVLKEGTYAAFGFRLTGVSIVLYEKLHLASTQLSELPSGALIVVLKTEDDFLRVLTADDIHGYIPRWTPMISVR